jgi:predicted TIM-barrel fold metal-dependent hydrolase
MKIVDAHAHLGFDEVFDEDFTEAALLESQERNGIDVTLVQPGTVHNLNGVRRQHDVIAELARRFPGRFYGIANPSPHLPGEQYEQEALRCVKELGFVGIKLHPFAHAVNPKGEHGRRVFRTAEELGVPVMVHTGSGIPWSAPSLLAAAAKEHPKLAIVVAHAGGMVFASEALQLAEEFENVYLECSWTGGFLVRSFVSRLGAHRVMFGSDHADNAAAELAKLRTAGLSEEELVWVLGGTALRVFKLDG